MNNFTFCKYLRKIKRCRSSWLHTGEKVAVTVDWKVPKDFMRKPSTHSSPASPRMIRTHPHMQAVVSALSRWAGVKYLAGRCSLSSVECFPWCRTPRILPRGWCRQRSRWRWLSLPTSRQSWNVTAGSSRRRRTWSLPWRTIRFNLGAKKKKKNFIQSAGFVVL